MLCAVSSSSRAQDPRDTTRTVKPQQPPTPPTGTPGLPGIRLRLGRDTLPLTLPSVISLGDSESFRQAQAQIEAARATAFQQNMRTIMEAVWGQVATTNFATAAAPAAYPGDLPPKPKPTVPSKPVPLLGEYADLGLQIDGRLEFRGEKNQSALCSSTLFFDPSANCRSAFEPLVDFQFAAKSGGTVADRVHVNLDYDTQREFDASNNISVYYEGKGNEVLQRLEVGNVTFQPPASRYITAGIPSGNYGIQAVMKFGSMRLKTILAQQKGNIVRDHVFTVGDRTLQAIDRKIEDYQFEPRRFFFTIDPKLLGNAYPNVDILDTRRMAALSASLPDTLRPTKIFLYRLLIGGQPPNPSGPQFRLIGDPRSRRGQVYEYLREGVDYYADPSLLWIALVRPLSLNNERLVVAYRVRINGRDTVYSPTGGTPDLAFTSARDQFANLIWDPDVQPGDPAFDREIRSVYRLGGPDVRRQSVTLKVVTGSSEDQEKPVAGECRHLPEAVRTRAGDQQLELRSRESHLAPPKRSELRAQPRLSRLTNHSRSVSDLSVRQAVREERARDRRQSDATTRFTRLRPSTFAPHSARRRSTTFARAIRRKAAGKAARSCSEPCRCARTPSACWSTESR